jgi:putative flavoprotein involved in K+ transport
MRTTAVVIGAGHAGLSMSRRLTERSVDHVVLDRGEVADSWCTKRWPGLTLLTPNWMVGLPGQPAGPFDPDGFLTAPEVATLIRGYARHVAAPVHPHTTVRSLRQASDGYEIRTNNEPFEADAVVIATGANSVPVVPGLAAALPPSVAQFTAFDYRGPDAVGDGGVLVVGASATGVQLAAELQRAGRQVTLAVGEHVRLPRSYRGHDIFWWLNATGVLDERHDEVKDLTRARHLPSPQLSGSAVPVDLASLVSEGVRLVGRLAAVDGGIARFSGSLRNMCALADLKMTRFLDRADEWARTAALDLPPPTRPQPTPLPHTPTLALDLTTGAVRTVVWATGFRPDYSWLELPVLDRSGRLRHHGGVITEAPGLYALGLPMLRTRASTYIHGASSDTEAVADRLMAHLNGCTT